MRIERETETLWMIREVEKPYRRALDILSSELPGVLDCVSSYDSVGVYADPKVFDPNSLTLAASQDTSEPKIHLIHVCYELGLDIERICADLNLSVSELITIHSSPSYTCIGLGFCPGFAYLEGLDPRISGLPRLNSPRLAVNPGSVGITGAQTAVYPSMRPGGWNLIGVTPQTIVDTEADYFPIHPGDQVRFVPIQPSQMPDFRSYRL